MPARNRLGTPLTLKQLLAAYQLGVIAIPNFEPRSLLRIVRGSAIFCDNALQVQLASHLEEGTSALFYVIGVSQPTR
jgi:hypothetical protein